MALLNREALKGISIKHKSPLIRDYSRYNLLDIIKYSLKIAIMSLSPANKVKRIGTSFLVAMVSILPELIPSEWKTNLVDVLGTNYPIIWTVIFILLSIAILLLTWNQSEDDSREYSYNSFKINGNKNQLRQGIRGTPANNKAKIKGDGNKVQQG